MTQFGLSRSGGWRWKAGLRPCGKSRATD